MNDALPPIPFLDLKAVNEPFQAEMQEAVARVVASGRYVGGPEVEAFEQELAQLAGSAHVVGVSNGLDALRLILRAYIEMGRLREGDEVIVPANTYVATVLAITDNRLVPVLVEPSASTLNLDTSLLESAITPRTRAVMTVHLYGRVAWDQTLVDVARRHNLLVIEDNAQAIGAEASTAGFSGSHRTGALGHAAAFSFYPTKNIGALGDAGAVATDDPELAKTVRALANYGSDRRYHNIYTGHNCRLDPIQAAVLRVKLPHTDRENAYRRGLAAIYESEIQNPAIEKPLWTPTNEHVWHQYVIRTPERDRLRQFLADNGVATDINYPQAPHQQPCYSPHCADNAAGNPFSCTLSHGPLHITEAIGPTILSLPIARGTTPADALRIAALLSAFPQAEI